MGAYCFFKKITWPCHLACKILALWPEIGSSESSPLDPQGSPRWFIFLELILYRTRLTENTSWLPYILQTIHCCTERKQSIKQNMEEIGKDAKVLISRNTFLSPETIMYMCSGRCVGGLIWTLVLYFIFRHILSREYFICNYCLFPHTGGGHQTQIYRDWNIPVVYSLPKM